MGELENSFMNRTNYQTSMEKLQTTEINIQLLLISRARTRSYDLNVFFDVCINSRITDPETAHARGLITAICYRPRVLDNHKLLNRPDTFMLHVAIHIGLSMQFDDISKSFCSQKFWNFFAWLFYTKVNAPSNVHDHIMYL